MPSARLHIPPRVAERAATNYTVVGEHWISNYSVASHGYAQIGWEERGERFGTTAHRAAWAHHLGQPGEQTVDHRDFCGECRYVRPDHLRLLPNLENARRTGGRDWRLGECIRGHDHATYWRPKGPKRLKGYCARCRWIDRHPPPLEPRVQPSNKGRPSPSTIKDDRRAHPAHTDKEIRMNQGMKQFAPETAVGTGAAEPLVDEVEAATQVPSVDESTAGQGKNYPGNEGDAGNVVVPSGDPTAEPTTGADERSTGEDYETRHAQDDEVPLAGAAVDLDDAEVNKPAAEVRPEDGGVSTKRTRKAKDTV